MGTFDGNSVINLDYPLALQQALIRALEARNSGAAKFRYIHLSGKLTVQNQTQLLWFMDKARKIKVRTIAA